MVVLGRVPPPQLVGTYPLALLPPGSSSVPLRGWGSVCVRWEQVPCFLLRTPHDLASAGNKGPPPLSSLTWAWPQHPLCIGYFLSPSLRCSSSCCLQSKSGRVCLARLPLLALALPPGTGQAWRRECTHRWPWEGSCSLPATPEVATLQPALSAGREAATPGGVPDPPQIRSLHSGPIG